MIPFPIPLPGGRKSDRKSSSSPIRIRPRKVNYKHHAPASNQLPQGDTVPRFKWNNPAQGRVLNRYTDTMCKHFPAIAKDVVKHGIGDLNYWFQRGKNAQGTSTVAQARCGCLVGTTCLVAMERYQRASDRVLSELTDVDKKQDAPMILYKMIVAQTGRDISRFVLPEASHYVDEIGDPGAKEHNERYDPLLVCIYQAGMAATNEAGLEDSRYDDDFEVRAERRNKEVVDRLEWRIRSRLGLLPKARKITASR